MKKSGSLAWLRLVRAANLPSAASNSLAGFLLAAGDWMPILPVLCAATASMLFYAGGIISNDLADLESDRLRRPERPLPSGVISPAKARLVQWCLFAAALAICIGLDWWSWRPGVESMQARTTPVGLALLTSILLYNVVLKGWLISALAMGLCRGLNLLLGAVVAWQFASKNDLDVSGWAVLTTALALSLLATGITLLARDEAAVAPRRWVMGLGVMSMAGALVLYTRLPESYAWGGLQFGNHSIVQSHLILVVVIGFTVLRSSSVALFSASPARTRTAIKTALFSIVTLDAATAWLASNGQVPCAFIILSLLGASLILARFSSPT